MKFILIPIFSFCWWFNISAAIDNPYSCLKRNFQFGKDDELSKKFRNEFSKIDESKCLYNFNLPQTSDVLELRNSISTDLIVQTDASSTYRSKPRFFFIGSAVQESKNITNEQFQNFDTIINTSDRPCRRKLFL